MVSVPARTTRRTVRRRSASAPARIQTTSRPSMTLASLPRNELYIIASKLNPYEKARLAMTSRRMYDLMRNNLVAYRRLAGTKPRRRKYEPPNERLRLKKPSPGHVSKKRKL